LPISRDGNCLKTKACVIPSEVGRSWVQLPLSAPDFSAVRPGHRGDTSNLRHSLHFRAKRGCLIQPRHQQPPNAVDLALAGSLCRVESGLRTRKGRSGSGERSPLVSGAPSVFGSCVAHMWQRMGRPPHTRKACSLVSTTRGFRRGLLKPGVEACLAEPRILAGNQCSLTYRNPVVARVRVSDNLARIVPCG